MSKFSCGCLALALLVGCARTGATADCPVTPDAHVMPGAVTSLEPLWVHSVDVKSPSYTLGGVIVDVRVDRELTRDELAQALGAEASQIELTPLAAASWRVVVRTGDPVLARAVYERAEHWQTPTC